MGTKAITDASFQSDVLDSDTPVLVDFWAEWCGPCKMIGPSLEEIADELAGKVVIAKMDISENDQVPGSLGIRSIPTLHIYKNGQKISEQIGIQDIRTKSALKAWVESVL